MRHRTTIALLSLLLAFSCWAASPIIRRVVSQKPPRGAVLDRGHKQAQGLVERWLMNQGVGNSTVGIVAGGTCEITGAVWESIERGVALAFDGTTSTRLKITPDYVPSTAISFTFWYRPAAAQTERLMTQDSGDSTNIVRVNSNGSITWFTNVTFSSITGLISAGQSHLIVCTGDATGLKIYVDGAEGGSDGTAYNRTSTAFWISSTSTDPIEGHVSGISIYNRALSVDEIQRLYREPYADISSTLNRTIWLTEVALPSRRRLITKGWWGWLAGAVAGD